MLAHRVARAGESLGALMAVQGVEATQNMAERAHRFGVLWRTRRQGPSSAKGNRWVESVRSLCHTYRIFGRPTFPILVEAVTCLFGGKTPDLRGIISREALPAYSTPYSGALSQSSGSLDVVDSL